ncbi:MAG: hypothetical protein Ct9H300mP17_03300 [Candidatus Nitrosopelagicus sp.]|nr:MAG: hypothetical protein Ct9H300mP17_03300 [Candidatus Nitrosopelagicus sp.]
MDKPILGNPDAKIYNSRIWRLSMTFCYKFHDETMKKIDQKYIKTQMKIFVYKDFPLNGPQ